MVTGDLSPASFRSLRQRAGWSVTELAQRAGVSRASIYRAEDSNRRTRMSTARAIAKALNVPITALFDNPTGTATEGADGGPTSGSADGPGAHRAELSDEVSPS